MTTEVLRVGDSLFTAEQHWKVWSDWLQFQSFVEVLKPPQVIQQMKLAPREGISLSPTLSGPFPKQHPVTAFTEQPPGSATAPRLLPFLMPLYYPAKKAPDAPHSSLWQITGLQLNSSKLGEQGVRQHLTSPCLFLTVSSPCPIWPLSSFVFYPYIQTLSLWAGGGKNPSLWVVPSLLAVLSSSFLPLSLKREPPHLG